MQLGALTALHIPLNQSPVRYIASRVPGTWYRFWLVMTQHCTALHYGMYRETENEYFAFMYRTYLHTYLCMKCASCKNKEYGFNFLPWVSVD